MPRTPYCLQMKYIGYSARKHFVCCYHLLSQHKAPQTKTMTAKTNGFVMTELVCNSRGIKPQTEMLFYSVKSQSQGWAM